MTNSYFYLRNREIGHKPKVGSTDSFYKSLYSSMTTLCTWDERLRHRSHGGVFNLEFSPDGSLLVAACEKKSFVVFDPLSQTEVRAVENAHRDCVNCVKFLDNRMFATCSDDTTIALWDVRNLKGRIRTLQGHSNWVKNIEYSSNQGLLVTSGFDGSIYTWDINSYTEHGNTYQRVFHTPGLMRCRITPDEQKLVICTTGGYLIVVHNLDLKNLRRDLEGFKPNVYRLMQVGREYLPLAANYAHLFNKSRSRNRVELITDFPAENDAEVISSLQIHPMGWCALSRNINNDESSEWTCIHDIQEDVSKNNKVFSDTQERVLNIVNGIAYNSDEDDLNEEQRGGDEPSMNPNVQEMLPSNFGNNSPRQYQDMWEATLTIRDHQIHTMRINRTRPPPEDSLVQRLSGINSGLTTDYVNSRRRRPNNAPSTSGSTLTNFEIIEIPPQTPSRSSSILSAIDEDLSESANHMFGNEPRLIYFKEEANLGKGFIKELCFSSDGRIVCSPFGHGIRLLSFNERCSELTYLNPINGKPNELLEVGTKICHSDIVVSTKFSPRHSVLVTGCLAGRIVWHQPVL